MPWDEIDAGVYDDRIAEVKKLIAVRQAHKPLQNLGDIEFISYNLLD